MNKGDAVLLIGKCESRSWKDKEGNDRVSHELTVYSVALPIYKRKDAGLGSKSPASRQAEPVPTSVPPDEDFPF